MDPISVDYEFVRNRLHTGVWVHDLVEYENGLLSTIRTEHVDADQKVLEAQDHVALEVECFLVQCESAIRPNGKRATLESVRVSEPLKKWHIFEALELFYREAHKNSRRDHYMQKWTEYDRLSRWAMRITFQQGIPVVLDPDHEKADVIVTAHPLLRKAA